MKQFIVETSARHVHVTQQDLETLFGKGYELTVKKMLSQPGQYASAERVDVVGPKKTLTGVSILHGDTIFPQKSRIIRIT